jgi:hypothetical protein
LFSAKRAYVPLSLSFEGICWIEIQTSELQVVGMVASAIDKVSPLLVSVHHVSVLRLEVTTSGSNLRQRCKSELSRKFTGALAFVRVVKWILGGRYEYYFPGFAAASSSFHIVRVNVHLTGGNNC